MGERSAIEWTEATWNPVMGCSRVSEGCRHCYAERWAARIVSYRLNGIVKSTPEGPRWTGEIRLNSKTWTAPLRWRRPRRIFVNSMSDLFHEGISDAHLDELWGLMAKAYWHTFQVLTKRPERMLDYLTGHAGGGRHIWTAAQRLALPNWANWAREPASAWPLPNVWLGVSVEDQATADARIPLLLQTPAAVRWVSYEPALGPVDFKPRPKADLCLLEHPHDGACKRRGLDWLVVGGESGPGARPFDLAWARSAIAQCRAAGVPVFVKQLGAKPIDSASRDVMCNGERHYTRDAVDPFIADCEARIADGRAPGYSVKVHEVMLRDRKGANPSEWPQDLCVREYPSDGPR